MRYAFTKRKKAKLGYILTLSYSIFSWKVTEDQCLLLLDTLSKVHFVRSVEMHFYIADVFITFDVAFFHGIGALLVRTERNISCKYCTSNSWNIGMPFATHVKNRVSISLANPKNGTRRRKEEAAGLSRSPNEVVSSSGKIPIPIARLWKEN